MQIMSQDHKRLVNSEYVSQFYVEETESGVKLIAAADVDILLGTYDKPEHAKRALNFISVCMVDEDAQGKITQTPTREDMALSEKLLNDNARPTGPESLRALFESVMSSGGGRPEILIIRKPTSSLC